MNIHFNGYKTRYQFMDYHIKPVLRSRHVRTLNIFINLDDLFHTLHRPLIDQEFQVGGTKSHIELVSNVFNLIGHYRNWALRMGCSCKIYAIYTSTSNKFKNALYVEDYRKKFFDINKISHDSYFFVNSSLHESYKILHVIAKYISGVYIIDSKYLEPSMVPMFLANERPADWNILISRDPYDIQYCYQDKWTYFSPKGDNSSHVDRENLWNYLNRRERIYKDPVDLHYHYGLYLLSRAVVGDTYRNIPRLRRMGWKTLFKYLDKVEEYKTNTTDNRIMQEKYFTQLVNGNQISAEVLNNHLMAIDVTIQMQNLLELDRSMILSQLTDMEDYNSLQDMNRTVFHLFPINLGFLCNKLSSPELSINYGAIKKG